MKSILQEFKQHLTEQLNNVTVLFPGGFKPITGAHLALANRYAENAAVQQVILLIGPKDRDGFTRTQTIQAFNLMNSNPKIRIQPTEFNSPIMAAYEYLFALPEDTAGQYAMAASAKGDDYVRTKSFVPNVDKYKMIGDKKGRKIPAGVDAIELTANADPITYPSGEPISATATRQAIADGDYNIFKLSYPGITDEILKNVWEIFTGKMVETIFSREWWSTQLAEDVDAIFENYITRQELDRIESAADRFFKEYGIDVDMQGKFTHFFDRLNDPRNEAPIYMDELEDMFRELADEYGEEIASQLQQRRDSAVVSDLATAIPIHMPFMLRYDRNSDKIKLIPRTIKKQRRNWQSNNPRDVKYTIEGYMDPKTAEKHKKKIEKLRKFLDKNTGKEFVYDFDTYDKTTFGVRLTENSNIRYTLPNFDVEWDEAVRYPEFKQLGKSSWIELANKGDIKKYSNIKSVLGNVDLNFDSLEEPKKKRFLSAFSNGNIEMPIAVKFNKDDYDLVAGNTRISGLVKNGIDPNIWIVDASHLLENKFTRLTEGTLLTEGGAAGHMAHPYDDHGLTFNEMKELISRALEGQLDIEEAVTEKTDGQNIQVTWKNGQVGFARNQSTIISPLSAAELTEKFSEYKGPIADAFREAAEDMKAAFSKINPEKLNSVFKNGQVFANMEIIYPATKNIISYDKAHLQFHNLVEYRISTNAKGKPTVEKVQTDLTGGALVQKIIQDANAHMQNTFSFIPPQKIKLGRIADFEDQQAALFAEVDQLKNQFNLKETDLLSDYHRAWWKDVIEAQAKKMNYDIPENVVDVLIDRWAFQDKSTAKPALLKMIDNDAFKSWVAATDIPADLKKYQRQNMEPFETIFLRLGALVLSNISEILAADPTKATQEIKKDIATVIKQVQQSKDPAVLKKVEYQLKRLERLGGLEKIVPIEGIVFTFKGDTYKLTGAFAPVNQLIGILKFGR